MKRSLTIHAVVWLALAAMATLSLTTNAAVQGDKKIRLLDDCEPVSFNAVLGEGAFLKPLALAWLLRGDYRATRDPSLSGLATPARISLLVIIAGLVLAGLLWLVSLALPA